MLDLAGDDGAAAVRAHLPQCARCRDWVDAARADEDLFPDVRRAVERDGFVAPVREGATLGRYRITRRLGAGGMGEVYEARQENPPRAVALKLLRPGIHGDRMLRRFEHEAEALGRLRHPGIAQIYEAATAPTPFLAMELVSGRPITAHAVEHALGIAQRLELLIQVCDAVQHAHQNGVIHRDLKPSNILVDETTGGPKILDFGVARLDDADIRAVTLQTDAGQLIGTLPYMSPEQCAGDSRSIDTRSDVYALGVILCELVSGRLPYDLSDTSVPGMIRTIQEGPLRLSRVSPDLAGDLETIGGKALARDPARRYQSASELAADLRRFLRHEPVEARAPSVMHQLRLFAQRNRALVAAAGSVALTLLVATIVSVLFALRADAERRNSAFRAYAGDLAAASEALRVNDVREARRRLQRADPGLRNWEWRHLVSRTDQSLRTCRGHDESINALAFSPDGRRLVSASGVSPGRDHTVRLWEVETGRELMRLGEASAPLRAVAFSPDGARVAYGGLDETVWVRDARDGTLLLALGGQEGGVADAIFSPDGSWLASAAMDGTVRFFDAHTGEPVGAALAHETEIVSLTVNPEGTVAATACRDGTAKLWDVATRRHVATLRAHELAVNSVAFSRDGAFIATGSDDRTIKLWDAATAQELATLRGHSGEIVAVAFSPARDELASVSWDRTLRVWSYPEVKELASMRGHADVASSLRYNPDATSIATGSLDATIKLWDAGRRQEVPTLTGHAELIRRVAFSPSGGLVASAAFDHTAKVWDVATRRELMTLRGHTNVLACVAFSPDGSRLATGSNDLTIRIWDAGTGRELRVLTGHAYGVHSIAFSPDGALLASGGVDRAINVWDVATGALVATWPAHEGWIWGVAFSPDGRTLASASADGGVRLWDARNWTAIATIVADAPSLSCLRYSHGGRWLASGGSDGVVYLWDAGTGERWAALTGHNRAVEDLAFSPDDGRLVSVALDDTLRIWDLGRRELVMTLGDQAQHLFCVDFSPDGKTVATAGGTHRGSFCEVKLWEAPSR